VRGGKGKRGDSTHNSLLQLGRRKEKKRGGGGREVAVAMFLNFIVGRRERGEKGESSVERGGREGVWQSHDSSPHVYPLSIKGGKRERESGWDRFISSFGWREK